MIRRDRRGIMAVALALSAACALSALVVVAQPAHAAITRAFTIRYQANDNGDVLLRGNSLLTCPPSAICTRAINRDATLAAGQLNNNNYAMQFDDTDGDPSTNSNSSADLTMPAGSTVLFSGLYWSAYTGSGATTTRTAPPAGTAKNRLLLKAPGDATYRTITASTVDDSTADGAPYSSFADVTSIVKNAGSGTYTGADIFAATGTDAYAAWSLVTVLRVPSMARRNLTVFDGFGRVASNETSIDIPLTGFETPPGGQVNVRLGTVAYEGDLGLTGDALQVIPPASSGIATTTLSDAQNPADNYFNSTTSDAGAAVPGRVPDGNTFGYDADVYQSNLLLGNNTTTATLRMTTGGETYLPAVATFVADIYAPDLKLAETGAVTDTNSDGKTRVGDTIRYTVDVTNQGNDDADDVELTNAIPAGTSYVPGSLAIDGTSQSDAADTDQGELSGSTVKVRLGTGAGGSSGSGGAMVIGATHRVTFTVRITGQFSTGGTITDSSASTYQNPDGVLRFVSDSNTVSTPVDPAGTDLSVTQTATPDVVQRTGDRTVTWTAHVSNGGPDTETAPQLVEVLPSGVTGVTVGGATCSTSGTTLTCPLPVLASGGSTDVTFTAVLPAGAADPSTATATVSGAGTDPTSANNTASSPVAVNDSPVAADDTGSLPSSALSVDVDTAANDSDPDGDPLHVTAAGPGTHGSATIVNGKVRYTLTDFHFVGTDTFPYTVCDDRGGCATANLAIAVASHTVSDLSVTQTVAPEVIQREGSRTVTWTVVVHNNGPDSDPAPVLTEQLPAGVTGVSIGGAACSLGGTTYTCPLPPLPSGDSVTVTFTGTLPVTASDPSGSTVTITGSNLDGDSGNNSVTTNVQVNVPPVAEPDTGSLGPSASSATIDVRANDSDADDDPLTISTVTQPGHGTATIHDGKVVYTLTDRSFIGDDVFTYTVCDGRSGCASTTVTVAVANHGHPPVAAADTVTTTIGTVVAFGVLGNDTDADGDTLTLQKITAKPSHGTAKIVGDRIVYTPRAGYTGTDALTYQTCDPTGLCDTAVVSITVTSLPPVANTDRGTVRPGGSIVVKVLGNDTDPDGDLLGRVTIVKQPSAGHATVDPNGQIRYTAPGSGVPGGKVTIRYRTCDASGACAEASVILTVAGTPVGGGPDGEGPDGDGPLAFTGAEIGSLVVLAFMLLLFGAGSIALGNRRSRPALAWRSYGPGKRYSDEPPRR